MEVMLQSSIKISPSVLFQELDGEAVLLNLENEKYYGLDEVATCMWHLLEKHGAIEPVIADMLNEYAVDEAALHHDLAEFIESMRQAGLISTEGASSGEAS